MKAQNRSKSDRPIPRGWPNEAAFVEPGGNNRRLLHFALQQQARAAGVSGFVHKGDDSSELISAIREVIAGQTHFSPTIKERLSSAERSSGDSRLSTLSSREMETLRYVAKGLSKKEIAPLMHISVKTVDKHVTQLMTKLDIHDRVGLARFAIREGLIEP